MMNEQFKRLQADALNIPMEKWPNQQALAHKALTKDELAKMQLDSLNVYAGVIEADKK